MSFRDDSESRHEREKSELRDEVDSLRAKLAETQSKLGNLSEQFEQSEDERKLIAQAKRGQRLESVYNTITWPARAVGNATSDLSVSLGRTMTIHRLFVGMFVLCFLAIIGLWIHHEFYDIRDGYVTGHTYVAGHYETRWRETCSGSGSNETCTSTPYQEWVPPSWTLDIAYHGESATWEVSQHTYDATENGDWYCARDIFHDEPCVRPTARD